MLTHSYYRHQTGARDQPHVLAFLTPQRKPAATIEWQAEQAGSSGREEKLLLLQTFNVNKQFVTGVHYDMFEFFPRKLEQ